MLPLLQHAVKLLEAKLSLNEPAVAPTRSSLTH